MNRCKYLHKPYLSGVFVGTVPIWHTKQFISFCTKSHLSWTIRWWRCRAALLSSWPHVLLTRLYLIPLYNIWNVKGTKYDEGYKYTYGTPAKFPELFRLQQAYPELPLHPLDSPRVFFYRYFICQPLITAYSANTSFIDWSYSVWVFRN